MKDAIKMEQIRNFVQIAPERHEIGRSEEVRDKKEGAVRLVQPVYKVYLVIFASSAAILSSRGG